MVSELPEATQAPTSTPSGDRITTRPESLAHIREIRQQLGGDSSKATNRARRPVPNYPGHEPTANIDHERRIRRLERDQVFLERRQDELEWLQ